jgi:type IV pilus assembly protein PilY1
MRFERDSITARAGGGRWRTVLVQGFGAGRPGYFALDVTDPVLDIGDEDSGPRFLWQVTQDSAGNPLFGLRGATPLITTLFFDDGGTIKEVAVAVLPGGSGGAAIAPPPGDTGCARKHSGPHDQLPADRQPRDAVNCYAASGKGGRSLTVVRLDSGEIIRTFRQEADEVPADLRDRVIETEIDSPITGQPVAFPSQTGAVADRIFVGDQDGTLWRVDVSSTDPDAWEMALFFDLYTGAAPDAGQPIDTPPILSVDDRGNITVAVSSGDQEVLTASDDVFTSIWSLTDEFDGESGDHETTVNWFFEFEAGERVTGPISLFSGVLFFSTFKPGDPTSACALGDSRIWGVHYLNREEEATPGAGGQARLPPPGDEACLGEDCVQFEDKPGVLIPGIAIGQQLSCGDDAASFEDPYLGFGQHVSMTSVTPGKFELMYHPSGSSSGGESSRVTRRDLASPTMTSRIDSWAAIVE